MLLPNVQSIMMPAVLPFLLTLALLRPQADVKLPAFPTAWVNATALATETKDGKTIVRLGPPPAGESFNAIGFVIPSPPEDRVMHLTLYLRGKRSAEQPAINAFAYSAKNQILKSSSTQVLLQDGQWTKAEVDLLAPAGTKQLTAFVINTAKTPLDVSDPSLVLGSPRLTALNGSGVLRASSQTAVEGKAGEIRFPVPSPYRDQAPISFKLAANPPEALKSFKLEPRGDNWICVAQIDPPGGRKVVLRWESLVLVRKPSPPVIPRAKFDEAPPDDVKGWLASTAVVQADDPEIKAKATELKKGCEDVETFVRKVIGFTSQNQGTGLAFVSLDAKTALGCGGSCTSRANLAAALLRAGGVPARTVPHLPTWAYGSPLYEHWLAEYWHPDVGWVWVEPTMGVFQPEPSTVAALAVSTIEDESATGKEGQLQWIMPGAAWMSGIQGFGGLTAAAMGDEGAASWCKPERRIDVSSELFSAARNAWPNIVSLAYVSAVDDLAMTGDPAKLIELLTKQKK